MVDPRRRLLFNSLALARSNTRIEKPQSPAGSAITEWLQEHQWMMEATQRDNLLLKSQEEPDVATCGQGEVDMTEANTDLVQRQLLELAQYIVHVSQACNEHKDVLAEELDSLENGIIIMESRLQTEKVANDSEVTAVGSMMQFREAMLEEIHSRIHVMQE